MGSAITGAFGVIKTSYEIVQSRSRASLQDKLLVRLQRLAAAHQVLDPANSSNAGLRERINAQLTDAVVEFLDATQEAKKAQDLQGDLGFLQRAFSYIGRHRGWHGSSMPPPGYSFCSSRSFFLGVSSLREKATLLGTRSLKTGRTRRYKPVKWYWYWWSPRRPCHHTQSNLGSFRAVKTGFGSKGHGVTPCPFYSPNPCCRIMCRVC